MNHSHILYHAYQTYSDITSPIRSIARASIPFLDIPWPWVPENVAHKNLLAACEVIALTGLTHDRPHYGIDRVMISGHPVAVKEEAALTTPFCTLLHFKKEDSPGPVNETDKRLNRQPNKQSSVLLVAPMSGHFATLLRGTVRTLLRDHDVYVTDWHNVRDTPLDDGAFGVDDYIDHLIRFLEKIGPGTHLMAVCQPTVAALAATAIMAEDGNAAVPASLTLMAGPIDCRVNPTKVNQLAISKPYEWFEQNLISVVPVRYDGARRRVYPGFLQISAFMSMNMDRHVNSFRDVYNCLVSGDTEKAENVKVFYEEYFAVMDLPAEFYLETIRSIFQEYHLPEGKLQYRGRTVNPAAIRHTPLFTVEGERDDICAIGQTLAAQDLCTGLRPYMKQHHVQTGVGHYGVFNGRRWENEIYPRLRDFIHVSSV